MLETVIVNLQIRIVSNTALSKRLICLNYVSRLGLLRGKITWTFFLSSAKGYLLLLRAERFPSTSVSMPFA